MTCKDQAPRYWRTLAPRVPARTRFHSWETFSAQKMTSPTLENDHHQYRYDIIAILINIAYQHINQTWKILSPGGISWRQTGHSGRDEDGARGALGALWAPPPAFSVAALADVSIAFTPFLPTFLATTLPDPSTLSALFNTLSARSRSPLSARILWDFSTILSRCSAKTFLASFVPSNLNDVDIPEGSTVRVTGQVVLMNSPMVILKPMVTFSTLGFSCLLTSSMVISCFRYLVLLKVKVTIMSNHLVPTHMEERFGKLAAPFISEKVALWLHISLRLLEDCSSWFWFAV